MKTKKKTAQLIMRITEAEKEFLLMKAEEENRTFTFKNVKKETLPLYNESVHIIEAL